MTSQLSPIDMAKFSAAKQAATYVKSGMKVGLGTGSTAAWLVRCLGDMVRDEGLDIQAVPTSSQTAELAREVGIKVISLDSAGRLDITIDGADEYDADHALIKGGGGALLQEKIVAMASDMMVVIADTSKKVATLGAFPLPIEVIPFGLQSTKSQVEELLVSMDVLGHDVSLRMEGAQPFLTDEGNHILDLHLGRIDNPQALSLALNQIAGVVENGLFVNICDSVVCGDGQGRVEVCHSGEGVVSEAQFDLTLDGANVFSEDS